MEIIVKSKKHGEKKITIDAESYDKIKGFKWCISYDKKENNYYAMSSIKKSDGKTTTVQMHRLLMDCPKGKYVDHVNHDTLDNRKYNLRICTNSQNLMNMIIKDKSKYKGVSKDKRYQKYKARIRFDGKEIYLGYFDTADQAAIAYNIAAVKYFGEFARPNENIMMHKGFH